MALRQRGNPGGRLTFGSSGELGAAISWPEIRAGTWSAHGKESPRRPLRPQEIRPDQGEASRLDLARSRLRPRAVTTPAAFQKRSLAAPRPRTPSPAGLHSLPGLARASSPLSVSPPLSPGALRPPAPGPEGVTRNLPGTPPNYNSRHAPRERRGPASSGLHFPAGRRRLLLGTETICH